MYVTFKSQPIQNFTTQLTLLRSPAHYESCGAIQSITCVLQVDLISRSKELSWFLGIAKFNFALNRKRDIIVPAVPTYLPTLILTAGQIVLSYFDFTLTGFHCGNIILFRLTKLGKFSFLKLILKTNILGKFSFFKKLILKTNINHKTNKA